MFEDYDPDRFDCEILIDRKGHNHYGIAEVADCLGISETAFRQRLRRGWYERPEIADGAGGGFVGGGNHGCSSEPKRHEFSKRQVIDMMLQGAPERAIPHGTSGGFYMERKRGLAPCPDCVRAEDERKDKVHARAMERRRAAFDRAHKAEVEQRRTERRVAAGWS